jgi:DNA-binding HxlR family transcriptional regulator
MEQCPIATTLGTLGRKWALVVLRDIAFFPNASFTMILKNNPGLRQRTLSLRLSQLRDENLVEKVQTHNGRRPGAYQLTPKGREVWPILSALFQYGVQNHADVVFADAKPRNLEDVFPTSRELMLGHFAGGPLRHGTRRSRDT